MTHSCLDTFDCVCGGGGGGGGRGDSPGALANGGKKNSPFYKCEE